MTRYQELLYRDCPWCGTKSIAMLHKWGEVGLETANTAGRSWGLMSCPRCGGVVAVELLVRGGNLTQGSALHPAYEVEELQSVPEAAHKRLQVEHLPADVARFFSDAIRVMDAGVPDAAAVQLRRTLEAAAAHKGIQKRTLVQSVQAMIDQQLVTKDFGEVLTHVRLLGNVGAHATDERLSEEQVNRALRFTTQFLRNVFEVPGELESLKAPESDEEEGDGEAVEA